MPRRRQDLEEADADRVRDAYAAVLAVEAALDRERREYRAVLRELREHYPVAAIARALGITPRAVWRSMARDEPR